MDHPTMRFGSAATPRAICWPGSARVRPGPLQEPCIQDVTMSGRPRSPARSAVSGGRAEAQRSRPERPALSKCAVGPTRDCGPPGSGAPLGARPPGRAHSYRCSRQTLRCSGRPMLILARDLRSLECR